MLSSQREMSLRCLQWISLMLRIYLKLEWFASRELSSSQSTYLNTSTRAAIGSIRAELFDGFPEEARPHMFASMEKEALLSRVGTVGETAEAYLYFMKAAFTTGTSAAVDGGRLIGNRGIVLERRFCTKFGGWDCLQLCVFVIWSVSLVLIINLKINAAIRQRERESHLIFIESYILVSPILGYVATAHVFLEEVRGVSLVCMIKIDGKGFK